MAETLDLPEIVTARLRLRMLAVADAADLARLTSDPAILAAVHFLADPFRPGDAERLIAGAGDGRDCFVGGRLLSNGELATVCGAHLIGAEEIEIGYWVGRDWRGQGFARETARAVLASLRDRHPHRRLTAECRLENRASWRLLETLGFRSIGEAGRRPGRMRLGA